MDSYMTERKFTGLSQKDIPSITAKYGLNTFDETQNGTIQIFLRQFSSPLVYLLIVASLISFFIGDITDGVIILILIIINTALGFLQEYRSNQLIEKLKNYLKSEEIVIRDGEQITVDKSQIFPGDIIIHKLGDIVAADAVILEATDLEIDESSVTGESASVYKQVNPDEDVTMINGVIYSGTAVVKGEAVAKVFATGRKSKFGEIADLSLNTKKQSEFKTNLDNLGKWFTIVSIISLIFILGAHFLIDKHDNFITLLLFTLAIAITIIPEALPVISTLTLSHGARKLSKKNVIVKKTASVEDLGNVDLICTDKTGTLTKNKLDIVKFSTPSPHDFFYYSTMLSAKSKDPLDKVIYEYSRKQLNEEPETNEFNDIPFNPVEKFSARKFDDFTIEKGAYEYILKSCFDGDKTDSILNDIKNETKDGKRAISVCIKFKDKSEYLGTFFMSDEIKEDAAAAIAQGRKQHIHFKIITGDALEIGIDVGMKVNLIRDKNEAIDAKNLHFDDLEILQKEVEKYKIFTRTDPVQKYNILKALQTKYHVGYLGDGINDAPSLKIANVGMVVDTASDIAKANADIILLTKSLSVIVDGVIEGRKVFVNIDKYLKHTLSSNFGNLYTVGIISLFLNFLPMLPVQILLNNLLCDLPCLAFATDNVDVAEIRRPKHHTTKNLIIFSVVLGLVASVFDILFFIWARSFTEGYIQSMLFVYSTIEELLIIFFIRTYKSIWKSRKPSKLLFLLTFAATSIALFAGIFGWTAFKLEAISFPQLLTLILFIIGYLLTTEVVKLFVNKKLLHDQSLFKS